MDGLPSPMELLNQLIHTMMDFKTKAQLLNQLREDTDGIILLASMGRTNPFIRDALKFDEAYRFFEEYGRKNIEDYSNPIESAISAMEIELMMGMDSENNSDFNKIDLVYKSANKPSNDWIVNLIDQGITPLTFFEYLTKN